MSEAGSIPPTWAELQPILMALLSEEPGNRAGRALELAAGDRRLAEAALEHLRRDEHTEAFLQSPLDGSPCDPGATVGPWTLVRRVGQGGMGVVWLAERPIEGEVGLGEGSTRQSAALKLLRPGLVSAELERRFAGERRVLARLSHPAIATLLDAGRAEDGSPWLAMQYVDGVPIDTWCTTSRASLRERIGLVRELLDALTHAHSNLVLHRDIKPQNVLVTERGRPVLLDFGIAKLLDGEDSATLTAERRLTPRYAAPEQFRGDDPTVATDVYQAGLLLYELCVGRPALDATTGRFEEYARLAAEGEARRASERVLEGGEEAVRHAASCSSTPSRLSRALSGDLDAILARCLRPEPEERYPSTLALAEDLARHLEARPVSARRGTTRYRVNRYIRRNRVQLAAAAIVFTSLVTGSAVAVRQTLTAESEAKRAKNAEETALRRLNDGQEFASNLVSRIYRETGGMTDVHAVQAMVMDVGIEYLEHLAAEDDPPPALLASVALGFSTAADTYGGGRRTGLAEFERSTELMERALEVAERALTLAPRDPAVRIAYVEACQSTMIRYGNAGRRRESLALLERGLEVVGAFPETDPHLTRKRMWFLRRAAEALWDSGRVDEALVHVEKAIELNRKLALHEPGLAVILEGGRAAIQTLHACLLVAAYEPLRAGREGECEAIRVGREALAGLEEIARYHPPDESLYQSYGEALRALIEAQLQLGNADRARELVDRRAGVVDEFLRHVSVESRKEQALADQALMEAVIRNQQGERDAALERLRKAIDGYRRCLVLVPERFTYRRSLLLALSHLAELGVGASDPGMAGSALDEMEEVLSGGPRTALEGLPALEFRLAWWRGELASLEREDREDWDGQVRFWATELKEQGALGGWCRDRARSIGWSE